ncbi:death domain-containing protein CRADD [Scyliorhinus canicula]|uniref:death domain-containing protein CRADD n=1 Tax=Scyliorhinus canicula TaxID=7830 RepID=UPI0018F615C9|nr:death domain-containing protein CRADD [Scyliorhinus canicula]
MEEKHRRILRRLRLELASQLRVDMLVEYLYQERLLSQSFLEEIRAEPASVRKALKLLDYLPSRGARVSLSIMVAGSLSQSKLIFESCNQLQKVSLESFVPWHTIDDTQPANFFMGCLSETLEVTPKLVAVAKWRNPSRAKNTLLHELVSRVWDYANKWDQNVCEEMSLELINVSFPDELRLTISDHILKRIPTDKQLNHLSSHLGPEWERIVVDLGLKTSDLYRCKMNHQYNLQAQILAAFILWKRRLGKRATVWSLCDSLILAETDPGVIVKIFQENH